MDFFIFHPTNGMMIPCIFFRGRLHHQPRRGYLENTGSEMTTTNGRPSHRRHRANHSQWWLPPSDAVWAAQAWSCLASGNLFVASLKTIQRDSRLGFSLFDITQAGTTGSGTTGTAMLGGLHGKRVDSLKGAWLLIQNQYRVILELTIGAPFFGNALIWLVDILWYSYK